MEHETGDNPADSMHIDRTNSTSSSSPKHTRSRVLGDPVSPNQHALGAVTSSVPRRRRTRARQWVNSVDSDEEDLPQVTPAVVSAVMSRLHQLQQEFIEQQYALAPQLIPANQALLAARVTELMQLRRGTKLAAAAPTTTRAAASASTTTAAAAVGGGSSIEDANAASTAAAVAHQSQCNAAAAAAASRESRPFVAKFSSSFDGADSSKRAHRLAAEQRLPEYVSWSYLLRTQMAAAHGARMFYTDAEGELVAASDDESDDQKPWSGAEGPSFDYALDKLAQEYSHHDDLLLLVVALKRGLDQENSLKPTDEQVDPVDIEELAGRIAHLRRQQDATRQRAQQQQQQRSSSFQDSAAVLRATYCRRCCIYNCPLHRENLGQPVTLPRTPVAAAAVVDAPPCSANCWKLQQGTTTTTAAAAAGVQQHGHSIQQQQQHGFSEFDIGLLQQGLPALGRDACSLAALLLDHDCCQVKAYLDTLPPEQGQQQQHEADDGVDAAAAAAAKRRKNNNKKAVPAYKHVQAVRRALMTDPHPYSPCSCPGPCKKGSCSCIDSGNYCERFCGCCGCKGRDCFFPGCKCATFCRYDTCNCKQEGRECDPEVCRNCTAATAAGTAKADEGCTNMGIRLRRYKRIYVGLSNISGWGAFIAEPAKKGEFLGEYVGEMITSEEADRRGKAYDRQNNSYLFGVNNKWVLDARDAGNKLRFANHGTQPNCQQKVVMVDGDHRVALYAKEDIAAGEELTYNYRYDLDNAPDWALRD